MARRKNKYNNGSSRGGVKGMACDTGTNKTKGRYVRVTENWRKATGNREKE